MFELPDAKRVRRSDLYARDDDSNSSARSSLDLEVEAELKARFKALYGDVNESAEGGSRRKEGLPRSGVVKAGEQLEEAEMEVVNEDNEHEGEHEFEFRLFSAPAMKPNLASKDTKMQDASVQKIILDDEEEDLGAEGGRFLNTRDPRIWIARNAVGERKYGFESMGVSGDDILRGREKRYWALEVPWRVRVLKVVERKRPKKDGAATGKLITLERDDIEDAKRKRPGKKRRLVLRERTRKGEVLKEARRKEIKGKEAAEKEKRTKRNREKKVKRKMKEKAKKEIAVPVGGEPSTASAQSSE